MKLQIYEEIDHIISKARIDQHALEIIHALKQAGHEAYLVGGGVRDLLLGRVPKDFDISTSAEPQQIRALFPKRCFLIGKRFQLAHVRFGNTVLEVSTFRTGDITSSSLILRDNRWGTAEEDVLRRDFTINALFYDPENGRILDYIGGYQDLHNRVLRSIGDPYARFRQDPVRMIRLLKFRARFDFTVEPTTEQALIDCKEEILKSAPARILEEIFKMLESGFSCRFFELMAEYTLLEILFPCFQHFFFGPNKEVAYQYLSAIDSEIQQGMHLDRALFMAALVFPILEQELITLSMDRQQPVSIQDIMHLSYSLLRGINISSLVHFPKKILATTHHILVQQYRFIPMKGEPRWNARMHRSLDNILALEFLRLRSTINSQIKEYYNQWNKIFNNSSGGSVVKSL